LRCNESRSQSISPNFLEANSVRILADPARSKRGAKVRHQRERERETERRALRDCSAANSKASYEAQNFSVFLGGGWWNFHIFLS